MKIDMFYIQLLVLQLQIVAAVILVLVMRLVIRKLPKVYSYLLWLLVFARLLCPVVPESHFGIIPSQTEGAAWVEQALRDEENVTGTGTPLQAGAALGQAPQIADGSLAAQNPENTYPKETEGQFPAKAKGEQDGHSDSNASAGYQNLKLIMVGVLSLTVWGLGVLAILGYNGFALLRIRRVLKNAMWVRENIYLCEGIAAPFTLGMLRPKIYIPQGLADVEQDYIICHERVHIRRKDYLVKNLAFVLTAFYWFNPFVWVAFYFLERDMEMSCDEGVIRLMGTDIKRQYSQSLLNFAEGKGQVAVTPLTFGENSVRQRVKNVLSYKNAKRWSILLGAVILLAAGIALFTTRAERENDIEQGDFAQNDVSDGDYQESQGLHGEYEEPKPRELIENKEAFEQWYGTEGAYDFSYLNTGFSTSYEEIVRNLVLGTDMQSYECYTDPVTSAVEILHLGEGEGQVDYEMIPFTVEGFDIPWLQALSYSGEGSKATVTYTFASDGSTVEIPMTLIEGSVGIWSPDEGRCRTVYQTRAVDSAEGGEPAYYIQTSQYGVYRLDRSGLRNLFPYYLDHDAAWAVRDDRMYFPFSTMHQESDLDFWEDVICVLDLETREYDIETYPITLDTVNNTSPFTWISVYGGFLRLYGNGDKATYLPLINTGKTALSSGHVWNGKAVAELNEEEQDTYGSEVREYLLSHPGELVELSNRTAVDTYVYVDMDGDGKTEHVRLTRNRSEEYFTDNPYDSYLIREGTTAIAGRYEEMYNGIWAVSPDGKEIVLALYGDGPSGDPMTFLYGYAQGKLYEIGSFPDDIRNCTIEDGVINGLRRLDVVQTDWVKAQYWFLHDEEGQGMTLILHPQDTYDFSGLNDIVLTTRLTVHTAPDLTADSHVLEPATVRFVKTDATYSWVYVETDDRDSGWFATEESGLQIPEAEGTTNSWEVFENLNMAD
ncbi:MAG: M56 family metallopeptidase [Butyrivibrio sp.]|nr:M56 family metallopeptidase [Muribaculum sp.]MCM1553406.1 M56 family metallopeptidase [Butyrivibrio sp.]